MNEHTVPLIAFIIFVLSFVPFAKWYLRRAAYVAAMDAIPGPRAYPLIGTTYKFFGVARKDIFRVHIGLHRLYPAIQRVWMGPICQVHLKRAEHVEKVLGATQRQHLQKSFGYTFLAQWLGEGLLISTGDKWHKHRKIITPTFHFSILESFCEIFAEQSNRLVAKLSVHCGTNEPIDVYPYVTKAALDIISQAAMGTVVNAQDRDDDNEYVNAVYETANLIVRRIMRPWLHAETVYRWSSDGRKFAKSLAILHDYSSNVIRQRRAIRSAQAKGGVAKLVTTMADEEDRLMGRKKRVAFLDLLLDTTSELSDLDIREEVDTFMFEGHDTTTSGITWTLLLLGLHPDVQEAVYQEQEQLFGTDDDGRGRSATVKDFNEMRYLDRVIKEALRLYPPVPAIGRTLSEPLRLDDEYTLPKGCQVNMDLYHLHRDERYFPDAERFDPDRWLPKHTGQLHPYAYVPFSAGNRNCIGQKFVVYEEKSMLSTIVRNFRFTTVGKREDVSLVVELILRPVEGVKLKFEKR